MMQLPSLSVVFPNYNHARFLPVQLDSMLRQSYRPKEIIIIDDASTDNSVEVIKSFMLREPRIQLICNERNMGVELNINRLIEMASGDYIYLSAADDMILPGFFEKSMTLLAQHPEAGLCSTVGRLIDEDGNDRGIRAIPVVSNDPCFLSPEQVCEKLCKYGSWISTPTMIARRDVMIQEGGQLLELGSFADTFLALIVALRHGACFIPEPLTCWRQSSTGHASSSGNDWEALLAIGAHTVTLMRTKYQDLFPIDYIDTFERHWKYMVSISVMQCLRLKQEQIMRPAIISLYSDLSHVDRASIFGMRLSVQLQEWIWRLSSMIKFGPWRWWIFGRLSIVFNLRKIVIIEHLKM